MLKIVLSEVKFSKNEPYPVVYLAWLATKVAYEHADVSVLRVKRKLVLDPNRPREHPWANHQSKSVEPSVFFRHHLGNGSQEVTLVSEYLQWKFKINTVILQTYGL